MKLRDHPLISHHGVRSWAPNWLWTGDKTRASPKGEVGVLKEVRLSSIEPSNMCLLIMEHEETEYMGTLVFDDPMFCRQMYGVLLRHLGRRIEEIGHMDLSHTL